MKRVKLLISALLVLIVAGIIVSLSLAVEQKSTIRQRTQFPANIPTSSSVYTINNTLIKNINTKTLYDMLRDKIVKKHGFQIILVKLNENEKRTVLKAWFKALGEFEHKLSVIPVKRVSHDKRTIEIDDRLLKADIVALSYDPDGIFIVEKTNDPAKDIATIVKTFDEVRAESTNIKNFNYIGYIGWITKDQNNVGKETVKVDYYIAKTTVDGKIYRFFLALPQHSAIGYNGYSPKKFTTITDWNTNIWEGQVLHDWGPKNEGSNTQISYTLTASAGFQGGEPIAIASATISYSVQGGLKIKWVDQTSPDTGCVKTIHEIPDSSSSVTYTVEPSSIGLLDPSKPGGFLPMIVDHDFKVELQKPVWWWTDTKTIDINFSVVLYNNSVNKI